MCDTLGDTLKTWIFTYDGDGQKVKQGYTEGTSTLTTYYYAGGSYEVQADGTTETVRRYYSIAGMTVAMRDGTSIRYFLTDHLGLRTLHTRAQREVQVVGVTDSTGKLISETRYLPSRIMRPRAFFASGVGEVRLSVGSIAQTDFGYTFQRNLPEMGLMDYKARFYNSSLGRFMQPDTIVPGAGNPQAYNRYGYVLNNPINANDPSGHKCVEMNGETGGCDRDPKPKKPFVSPQVNNYPSDIAGGYFPSGTSFINYDEESANDSGNQQLNNVVGINTPRTGTWLDGLMLVMGLAILFNNAHDNREFVQKNLLKNPPEVITALYYDQKVTGISRFDKSFINLSKIILVNNTNAQIDFAIIDFRVLDEDGIELASDNFRVNEGITPQSIIEIQLPENTVNVLETYSLEIITSFFIDNKKAQTTQYINP